MIPNNTTYKLYSISYLLLFLQSMHVWFLWGNFFKIICPISFLLVAYLNHTNNPQCYQRYKSKSRLFFAIIIFFIALREAYDAGFLSICKSIIGIAALLEITKLSRESVQDLLCFLTKCFGVISIVSLVGWILFLVGFNLPNYYIVDNEFGYTFQNYYVFLYNMLGAIPRYCSIFLEPGYYGQLAAIILYANKMRLNNIYTISIFIGVLFSLSLAGYVLVAMGFIFTCVKKENFVKLLLLLGIGYGSFIFITHYNNGDNPINDLIFARLEIQDGKLAGDHRTTDELDNYLETTLITSGKYLFGVGSAFSKMDWGRGVAGYKAYIVENGYVGLFLAILGYLLMLFRYKNVNMHMKLCFVLFMMMYWQAAYPYWFGFFSIYIFSLGVLYRDDGSKHSIFSIKS